MGRLLKNRTTPPCAHLMANAVKNLFPAAQVTIGPVIEKQQKIVNDCVEKKLSLSKLQSSIWEKSNNQTESFSLSDLDDDLIQNLMQKEVDSSEDNYKL